MTSMNTTISKESKINKLDKIYFALITTLGILARVLYIYKVPCEPISDFDKYQTIATNIFMRKGHYYLGKPTAFQPMGYPFTLGYFYKLIGSNDIFFGKVLNVLLSSLTLVIILFILLKLFNNMFTIYLSYIIITFIPNYIAYNNVLGSEVLITFLLSIIIYLQLCDFNYKFRYILIGIFIGLAALTKPFFLLYPFMVSIIQWLKNKDMKDTIKLFSISIMFMCLVVAPWSYRNYKKFKLFIPISHNGGYVLFINNNSNNKTGAWMPVADIDVSKDFKKKLIGNNFAYRDYSKDEIDQVMLNPQLDKIFKTEAKKWILNNPIEFSKLGAIRFKNTFFNGAGDINQWAMNSKEINKYSSFLKSRHIQSIFDKLIFILSSVGFIYIIYNLLHIIVAVFKRNSKINYRTSILFFNISYFALICFVFEGQQRYNFPILFLLSICLGVCIEKIINYIKKEELYYESN